MSKLKSVSGIATILLFALHSIPSAQTINITGTVVDSSTSQGIANAKVKLMEYPNLSATTNASGQFTLSGDPTGVRNPSVLKPPSGGIVLRDNALYVNSSDKGSRITVDAFTALGKRIYHGEKPSGIGTVLFDNLWQAKGFYFVKVLAGEKQFIIRGIDMGAAGGQVNENKLIAGDAKGLKKTAAVYTLEATAAGYDSKQVIMTATTGSAGTIKLSTYAQAPGTWKNVTPSNFAMGYGGVDWIMADPVRQSDIYVFPNDGGCWKSNDYGLHFVKITSGTEAPDHGRPWGGAIDKNLHRNPATPPTMYLTSMYGVGGVPKSTDGGVHWTNVWTNNIYAPDGVTNISTTMGTDVGSVIIIDSLNCNNLICVLHGTSGPAQYNGIFETTDGGTKWKACPPITAFAFNGSNDMLCAFENVWFISHQIAYQNHEVYRTADHGATWQDIGKFDRFGRIAFTVGPVWYVRAHEDIWKSTNSGVSWTALSNAHCAYDFGIRWITVTATKLYSMIGWKPAPAGPEAIYLYYSSLTNDNAFTQTTPPPELNDNGDYRPATVTDGNHYYLIAAENTAGIWRYVEP